MADKSAKRPGLPIQIVQSTEERIRHLPWIKRRRIEHRCTCGGRRPRKPLFCPSQDEANQGLLKQTEVHIKQEPTDLPQCMHNTNITALPVVPSGYVPTQEEPPITNLTVLDSGIPPAGLAAPPFLPPSPPSYSPSVQVPLIQPTSPLPPYIVPSNNPLSSSLLLPTPPNLGYYYHYHHHQIPPGLYLASLVPYQQQQQQQQQPWDAQPDHIHPNPLLARETHQLAEANQEKNLKLREAFGLSEHYVDGSSFDPERKAKEEAAKALAQKQYSIVRSSSSSRSPSPPPKKKKKKSSSHRSRSESPSPSRKEKKKKSKKHKRDG